MDVKFAETCLDIQQTLNGRLAPVEGTENLIVAAKLSLINQHKLVDHVQGPNIINGVGNPTKLTQTRGALADVSNIHPAATTEQQNEKVLAVVDYKENERLVNIDMAQALGPVQAQVTAVKKTTVVKGSLVVHNDEGYHEKAPKIAQDLQMPQATAFTFSQQQAGPLSFPLAPSASHQATHHGNQPTFGTDHLVSSNVQSDDFVVPFNTHNQTAQYETLRSDFSHHQYDAEPARDLGSDSPMSSASENWMIYEAEQVQLIDQGAPVFIHTLPVPEFTTRIIQELDVAEHLWRSYAFDDGLQDSEETDPTMVSEYSEDIFEYLRVTELKMLPRPDYIAWQSELTWDLRACVMNWIINQHMRLDLLPETLYLAVNFIDRLLSVKVISSSRLQLVGATAILIAAKYEEINAPSLHQMELITDSQYKADDFIRAERYMLEMLDYELGFPGPLNFLRRISKADGYDFETRTVAKYFLEATVLDERFVGSPPSYLAAASHCLARLILGLGNWSPGHVHLAGYTYPQLLPALKVLVTACRDPCRYHHLVWSKYATDRFRRASEYVYHELKHFRLPLSQPSPHDYVNARGPRAGTFPRMKG